MTARRPDAYRVELERRDPDGKVNKVWGAEEVLTPNGISIGKVEVRWGRDHARQARLKTLPSGQFPKEFITRMRREKLARGYVDAAYGTVFGLADAKDRKSVAKPKGDMRRAIREFQPAIRWF